MSEYKVVSDKYIESLFEGTFFGSEVDGSIERKIELLKRSLVNQVDGYWSGSTIYSIMIVGGFLADGKSNTNKKLTKLGEAFLTKELISKIGLQ